MKTLDQTQKASEERFLTHDKVIHSYLWNVLCMFFIRIKNNCFSKTYSEIKSKWYKSIQARKKLVCRVAVKNCLCNVLCKFLIERSKAQGGAKSKNRHPSWLYYTVVGLSEAATKSVLQKKLFLKNSQYSQKKTCVGVSL